MKLEGKIKLAAKPAHCDSIARGFERLNRECDPDTELLPRARVREEIGSDAFFGALVYRKSAMMQMGKFGAGLGEVAARAGACIFENTPVTGFPQLGNVGLDYCWGGLVDITADKLARAGEHDGLFYAMGLSGHGAQMSVHLGQQMARVMAGEAAANPFGKLEWNAIAINYGTPWFLPLVGAYCKFKDRIG